MTLIYELVFVLAVTEVTFGSMGIRLLTKIGAVFYCVSFLLGGSVFALLMMIGAGGTVNNGFIYIGSGGYLLILAGAAAGGGMALWILKYVKRHSSEESSVFQLTIDLMNKNLEVRRQSGFCKFPERARFWKTGVSHLGERGRKVLGRYSRK